MQIYRDEGVPCHSGGHIGQSLAANTLSSQHGYKSAPNAQQHIIMAIIEFK